MPRSLLIFLSPFLSFLFSFFSGLHKSIVAAAALTSVDEEEEEAFKQEDGKNHDRTALSSSSSAVASSSFEFHQADVVQPMKEPMAELQGPTHQAHKLQLACDTLECLDWNADNKVATIVSEDSMAATPQSATTAPPTAVDQEEHMTGTPAAAQSPQTHNSGEVSAPSFSSTPTGAAVSPTTAVAFEDENKEPPLAPVNTSMDVDETSDITLAAFAENASAGLDQTTEVGSPSFAVPAGTTAVGAAAAAAAASSSLASVTLTKLRQKRRRRKEEEEEEDEQNELS
jgi:hypothetical protein